MMNMLKRILKVKTSDADYGDKKTVLSNKSIIVLIIAAALIMFFNTGSLKNDTKQNKNSSENNGGKFLTADYEVFDTEKRLEEILKKISGAGDVSVMIYYSNLGEKIVASDLKTRTENENKGEEMKTASEDKEENTVLYGKNGAEMPFVTEERLPEPSGVLVIAEGAENEKVKYEISEAVRALLGLAPNRIRVSARNKEMH